MTPTDRAALIAQARGLTGCSMTSALVSMPHTLLTRLVDALEESDSVLAARDERIRVLVEAGNALMGTHGDACLDPDVCQAITGWRAIAHPEPEEPKT